MSTHESLWLRVDPDVLRAIDELAKAKGITRHEAARIVLRLGVELLKRKREG